MAKFSIRKLLKKGKKKQICFVTRNREKLKEAGSILSDFEIISHEFVLPELQGDPSEIAKQKAKEAYKLIKKPVFVEDVSLHFNALNGMPGPYINDFLIKLGNEKLVKLLNNFEDKSARAVCFIGYCDGEEPKIFDGVVHGKIVEPKGKTDFGWDPIFSPDGYSKTFAEMDSEEKNSISHRRKALMKLKEHLEELDKSSRKEEVNGK